MTRIERTMALVRWVLLAAVASLAAYTVYEYAIATRPGSHAPREDRYYCPMHPDVRSPDPGECPICHMQLEPIPPGSAHTHGTPAADAGTPEGLVAIDVPLARRQEIGIVTTEVVRRDAPLELSLPAAISAREGSVSEVRVRTPSFVERLVVSATGTRVGRGQVLAYVYSPEVYRATQEVIAARGFGGDGGAAIEREGRRGLELLGVERTDVDAALAHDSPTRGVPLRAVSGGVVTRFEASVGRYVTPEETLYEITDLSRVWITASVPERDVAKVHAGLAATFVASAGARAIDGRVELVEPSVDPTTRAARVRMTLKNADGSLRPGELGSLRIALPAAPSLVVPADAIVDTGRARYVYVESDGGRFVPRVVDAGATISGLVVVDGGLREGERVVVRGAFLLDSESRLESSLRAPAATTPAHEGHAP